MSTLIGYFNEASEAQVLALFSYIDNGSRCVKFPLAMITKKDDFW